MTKALQRLLLSSYLLFGGSAVKFNTDDVQNVQVGADADPTGARALMTKSNWAASVDVLTLPASTYQFGSTSYSVYRDGFTDGTWAYWTPGHKAPVIRFLLSDWNTVETLDVYSLDPDLWNFGGSFTDGTTYGYMISYTLSGKLVRFSLSDFSQSSVTVLDLSALDSDLRGWRGPPFVHGGYAYLVPGIYNSHGKVARIPLNDFTTFDVASDLLDLKATDTDLWGFGGSFTDGTWGYMVPYAHGSPRHGKVARFLLSDFSTIQTLDLTQVHNLLMGFYGGFHDGTYGYVVPYVGPYGSGPTGRMARFSLSSFDLSSVEILNFADVSADLVGFKNGFTDGTYGYLLPYANAGRMARFLLSDFTTSSVEVIELSTFDNDLKQILGVLVEGTYAYMSNWNPAGKMARLLIEASAPAPTEQPATATGDPHLQNMLGQRFDLMRPGTSVLVRVPRGTPIEDALLVVKADARRLGAQCSDMYFQEINVTGTWADKAQPGGFHFDARGTRHENPQWVHLGPVELKVGHGHTDKGILYLNVFVKNLGRAGVPVGGLLGEDDHTEAAAPADGCQKTLSLKTGPHGLAAHRQGSIAVGS